MKIGLFTDTYHPAVNGICFVVDITRRQLELLGHEVYIFAPKPSIFYKEKDDHIVRYPSIRGVSWDEDMTSIFFPPLEVKKIKDLELDIIHFFTPDQVGLLGAYAGIKNNIPTIAQHCTDVVEYLDFYSGYLKALMTFPLSVPMTLPGIAKDWRKVLPRLEKRSFRKLRKRVVQQYLTVLFGKCDGAIALSRRMYDQLESWDGTFEIRMIPTGVDELESNQQDITKLKKRYKISPKDKVILYVGRMAEEKNLDLLIEAFAYHNAKNPDSKLLMVGTGDYLNDLKDLANTLLDQGKFVFTGAIKHKLLGSVYKAADLFAFPSLTDTQGLVLNEAANAGLPIVTATDDMNEIIQDKVNGFVVGNSASAFAKSFAKILDDVDLYKSMAAQSKKIAKKYTEKKQTEILVDYYQEIIDRHHQS